MERGGQPELEVGEPNDRYEREADRVADRVMRSTEPTGAERPGDSGEVPGIQRVGPATGGTVGGDVDDHLESLRGGRSLPGPLRSFFEGRFGHDFGAVRIHSGPEAREAARAIGARAFALGGDVILGRRSPPMESPAGRRLLAHELAHVVQQGAAPPTSESREGTHGTGLTRVRPRIQGQYATTLSQGGGFGGIMERDRQRARAVAASRPLWNVLTTAFSFDRSAAVTAGVTVYRHRNEISAAADRAGIPAAFLGAIVAWERAQRSSWLAGAYDRFAGAAGLDPSVGVTQMRISTAAMALGEIDWTEAESATSEAKGTAREQVATDYGNLDESRRERLFQALLEPGTAIPITAVYLARLRGRSNRYPDLTADEFEANRRALSIIATEYHIGPTETPEGEASPAPYGRHVASLVTSGVVAEVLNA